MEAQFSGGGPSNNVPATYVGVELTDTGAGAVKVANKADLLTVGMFFSGVSTATEITWYLASDEDGDFALTDEFTSPLRAGQTSGRASIVADVSPATNLQTARATAGSVWLFLKSDDADGLDLTAAELRWKPQVEDNP